MSKTKGKGFPFNQQPFAFHSFCIWPLLALHSFCNWPLLLNGCTYLMMSKFIRCYMAPPLKGASARGG